MEFKDLSEEEKLKAIYNQAFMKCQTFIFQINEIGEENIKESLERYIEYNKQMIDYMVEKTNMPKEWKYY